jgi:hypothetical protein
MSSSPDRTIEIIVSPTGHTRITTRGYSGTSCKEATRELERSLGLVQSDTATPEMYQAEWIAQNQNEQRQKEPR